MSQAWACLRILLKNHVLGMFEPLRRSGGDEWCRGLDGVASWGKEAQAEGLARLSSESQAVRTLFRDAARFYGPKCGFAVQAVRKRDLALFYGAFIQNAARNADVRSGRFFDGSSTDRDATAEDLLVLTMHHVVASMGKRAQTQALSADDSVSAIDLPPQEPARVGDALRELLETSSQASESPMPPRDHPEQQPWASSSLKVPTSANRMHRRRSRKEKAKHQPHQLQPQQPQQLQPQQEHQPEAQPQLQASSGAGSGGAAAFPLPAPDAGASDVANEDDALSEMQSEGIRSQAAASTRVVHLPRAAGGDHHMSSSMSSMF